MSELTKRVQAIEARFEHRNALREKIDKCCTQLEALNGEYLTLLEAQQILSTVSDNNTNIILDYITGVINNVLGKLFPCDERRIVLEKSLQGGQKAKITVKLLTGDGVQRNLETQSGTGLRQIISELFAISLIEVRKGRRIFFADELISGLHPVAKKIFMEVIKIFAEDGFQFVFIEYGVPDVGKIYLVEKPNDVATVTPLDGAYNNQVFMFNKPDVDFDISIFEDHSDDEDTDEG